MRKWWPLSVLCCMLSLGVVHAQTSEAEVDYVILAEGTDAPIEAQAVCFNKFFNLEHLPEAFLVKYGLDQSELYKKRVVVDLFHQDVNGEGLDAITVHSVNEIGAVVEITYDVVNSDTSNDDQRLAPFIVLQLPKLKRKSYQFVVNGRRFLAGERVYVQ